MWDVRGYSAIEVRDEDESISRTYDHNADLRMDDSVKVQMVDLCQCSFWTNRCARLGRSLTSFTTHESSAKQWFWSGRFRCLKPTVLCDSINELGNAGRWYQFDSEELDFISRHVYSISYEIRIDTWVLTALRSPLQSLKAHLTEHSWIRTWRAVFCHTPKRARPCGSRQ